MGASSIDRQIAAVERELALRRNLYPRKVAIGKMRKATADEEIGVMQDVLATLRNVRDDRRDTMPADLVP